MKQIIISISVFVVVFIVGCGGSGSSTWYADYNSVYGVNALSTDENISLQVGEETIPTIQPYGQNASIVEKALGSNNTAFYTVTGGSSYGDVPLQRSKTYFYAAADCNDTSGVQEVLYHIVETDTQIKIVNTSSDIVISGDVNISVDGGQINDTDTNACTVVPTVVSSVKDQNISVSFGSGFSVWKVLPSNVSVDVVIYGTPPTAAAIIPLPRLTPDAL